MTSLRALFLGALVLGAAALGGCARTICDDAVDKLNACDLPSSGAGLCDTAVDECEARCINTYSCDEIRQALTGTPNAYSACDDACR